MADTTTLLTSLRTAHLLPSPIIPPSFTPTYTLTIAFPSLTPQNGALARVSQVASQPRISMTPISASQASDADADSTCTFTFMQIDPDAPTPADPKFGYWRHWIVSGIPYPYPSSTDTSTATTSAAEDVDIAQTGHTITPYLAPGPKDESGPHRYLFLLFRETGGKGLQKEDVGGDEFVDRRSFRAEEVVGGKGLELVGVQWMRGVGDGWVEENGEL
ncbi:PEBP-like protein [Plenodomus tracheiphilus IPT5]|uniref:PEBP-like protein n=1 Tax=Plenodomus tracheiphilus IPT5 TaxID=1408161 RepID=A0A6A7B1W6_9PLEO|nr:PEBP-like protein [Plenodomus tracheiphilus IPT5]